jgi:glucose/arabinose dehydrogenase
MTAQRRPSTAVTRTTVAAALLFVLAGCTAGPAQPNPGQPNPTPTASNRGDAAAAHPVGTPTVVARGLEAPWSLLRLDSGSTLVSERDAGRIVEVNGSGSIREVGEVDGVVHQGEGGLLGLAMLKDGDTDWLYAYETTATDNRIVRMPLRGSPGSYSLGDQHVVLKGLAKAGNHDGGRIAFGPDGKLYATVGDASVPARAQDRRSLNGKILRMEPDGSVPADNPFDGSLVYSMGHRNPQGLAWDADGQLWAAEFGQDTWDEINRIRPGANYGWPTVEGIAKRDGFVDPVYQWATSDASPSGLAYVDGALFMAALRGERLWVIQPGTHARADAFFDGDFGRIRDAVPGPDGSLWILTNNTDGRGSPRDGDDTILQVELESGAEG